MTAPGQAPKPKVVVADDELAITLLIDRALQDLAQRSRSAQLVQPLCAHVERCAARGLDSILPLLDELERELVRYMAGLPGGDNSGDNQMRRIAVVEDNVDNRVLVQAILEDRYRITEYENGRAALEGLRAERPDLVLLDISLPGMNGTEVLREIRADEGLRTLPVIALTAHAMAGDRERFLEAGFDDYMTKPIMDEQLLLNAIEYLLPG